MRDPYLYDNSAVLINKLDIRNSNELDIVERNITAARLMQIDNVTGDFDYQRYKKTHEFIFGDIYDWAGKERIISMQKAKAS